LSGVLAGQLVRNYFQVTQNQKKIFLY